MQLAKMLYVKNARHNAYIQWKKLFEFLGLIIYIIFVRMTDVPIFLLLLQSFDYCAFRLFSGFI